MPEEEKTYDQESVATYDNCNRNKSTKIQEPWKDPRCDSGIALGCSDNDLSPASPYSVRAVVRRNVCGLQNLCFTMPESLDVLPRF